MHGFQPARSRPLSASFNPYERPPTMRRAPSEDTVKIRPRFNIDGLDFVLIQEGKKLKRLTPTGGSYPVTPPSHQIAGVKFFRTKGGNLLRHKEYLELQERQLGLFGRLEPHRTHQSHSETRPNTPMPKTPKPKKAIAELCIRFTTTGTPSGSTIAPPAHGRRTANPYLGQCDRDCNFVHDVSKVAACKPFLFHGSCYNGSNCPLSHDLTPQRVPFCTHYVRGNCQNGTSCSFVHVKPKEGAKVCYPFGKLGFCSAGSDCPDIHVFECPDYANTGECENKHCRLQHTQRAGQMRKLANTMSDNEAEAAAFIGSDNDEQATSAFSQQADYIKLG